MNESDVESEAPEKVLYEEVAFDLDEEGIDTSWISGYDAEKVLDAREGNWREFVNRYAEPQGIDLVMPNRECAVLWVAEIAGQISDGAWENHNWSPDNSWEELTCANISILPANEDAETYEPHESLDYVGEASQYEAMLGRMVFYVRAALDKEDYTISDVKKDLARIEAINY